MKEARIIIFLIFIIVVGSCRRSELFVQFYTEDQPVLIVGSEEAKTGAAHVYKYIERFYVDLKGNIYVGDLQEGKVDKFDPGGNYLYSFGRRGNGPGEFPGAIPPFALNSRGMLYTYSLRKKFIVFNPDGSFREEINFPSQMKNGYVAKIKIDYRDDIYVLFSFIDKGFQLVKFDRNLNKYRVIHQDQKRKSLSYLRASFLPPLVPDFDFDSENNLYVTDSVDYMIYVYSPDGDLLNVHKKDFRKIKITISDLVILGPGEKEIINLSRDKIAQQGIASLKGNQKYFPSIFGINVGENKIFIWTSRRDKDFKYIIDIYDKKFKLIAKSSAYNWITHNLAIIRNHKFYIPNLGSNDLEFKRKLGRFSPFNIPYKIFVYEIKYDKDLGVI